MSFYNNKRLTDTFTLTKSLTQIPRCNKWTPYVHTALWLLVLLGYSSQLFIFTNNNKQPVQCHLLEYIYPIFNILRLTFVFLQNTEHIIKYRSPLLVRIIYLWKCLVPQSDVVIPSLVSILKIQSKRWRVKKFIDSIFQKTTYIFFHWFRKILCLLKTK